MKGLQRKMDGLTWGEPHGLKYKIMMGKLESDGLK